MPIPRHGQTAPLDTPEGDIAEINHAAVVIETPGAVIAAAEVAVNISPTHFGFIFEELQSDQFRLPVSKATEDALKNLGDKMRDPGRIIPDSKIPAAYTYFGQFVDHDITSEKLIGDIFKNVRSPRLDLDSVYGPGSVREDDPDGDLMKLGPVSRSPHFGHIAGTDDDNDLPRDEANRTAQIPDPRNDENLILAQLQVAFLRAHNNAVKKLGLNFEDASRVIRQHYQWIVLEDFLKKIADPQIVDDTKKKNSFFLPGDDLFIPREFSAAAFRFGHSMVREGYNDFNEKHSPATLAMLFNFTGFGGLSGNKTLPEDWITDWSRFLDVGKNRFNLARRIDTTVVNPLFNIPTEHLDNLGDKALSGEGRLTVRNLLRGYYRGLPTGQAVAERMGLKPLEAEEIEAVARQVSDEQLAAVKASQLTTRTPLWYYILAEAAHFDKDRLGPVGSTIVAEVLIEILRQSTDSILGPPFTPEKPWVPSPDLAPAGKFDLSDFLRFAEVLI